MQKVLFNSIMLMAAIFIIVPFASCNNESVNDDKTFCNPENTIVTFTTNIFSESFKKYPENVISPVNGDEKGNVTSRNFPQNVKLSFTDGQKDHVKLIFTPVDSDIKLPGISSETKIFNPSAISLNQEFTFELPVTLSNDKILRFNGDLTTNYCKYNISATLTYGNNKRDISDKNNTLTIDVKDAKLINAYGWTNRENYRLNRAFLKYRDEEPDAWFVKFPQDTDGDESSKFLNSVLNTFDSNNLCVGNIFDSNVFKFDESGNLIMSNGLTSGFSWSHTTTCYFYSANVNYFPASIRFVALSPSEVLLFGFPNLFMSHYQMYGDPNLLFNTDKRTAKYLNLVKLLGNDIENGIKLTKLKSKVIDNNEEEIEVAFNDNVSRAMLMAILDKLSDANYRNEIIDVFISKHPETTRSELDKLIDKIPNLIDAATEVSFGCRMRSFKMESLDEVILKPGA